MLSIGDQAPLFTLRADNDELCSLSQFIGKQVILYFYPKNDTPGCTKEACDLRDLLPSFTNLNTVIIGVSKDSTSSHNKFKSKYQLPFILVSDPNAEVCTKYEVMNPKSMFGKSFLSIQRSTFLIDANGIIKNIWRNVKVPGHAAMLLNNL